MPALSVGILSVPPLPFKTRQSGPSNPPVMSLSAGEPFSASKLSSPPSACVAFAGLFGDGLAGGLRFQRAVRCTLLTNVSSARFTASALFCAPFLISFRARSGPFESSGLSIRPSFRCSKVVGMPLPPPTSPAR